MHNTGPSTFVYVKWTSYPCSVSLENQNITEVFFVDIITLQNEINTKLQITN
jgi:hypothetical protein